MKIDMTSENGWDTYFMSMADLVATRSKDRSIKCGCVVVGEGNIVLSTGYNGFPRGSDDDNEELHKRPTKYVWTEHDARNAIYSAARNGTKLLDSRMYLTSHPCHDCARAISQAGIVEVIIHANNYALCEDKELRMDWEESCANARDILKSGNVMVTEYGI